jgi:acetyl esterase/lipase
VQDTKEAIRYLRAHAGEYHIDTAHVGLLGDSSGGHTVAMAALTGDEPRFNWRPPGSADRDQRLRHLLRPQ